MPVSFRRAKLFEEAKGLCHWCGNKTVLEPGSKKSPKNMATIDHIHDVYDRRRYKTETKDVVLACKKCNQKRGNEGFLAVAMEFRVFHSLHGNSAICRVKNRHVCLFAVVAILENLFKILSLGNYDKQYLQFKVIRWFAKRKP